MGNKIARLKLKISNKITCFKYKIGNWILRVKRKIQGAIPGIKFRLLVFVGLMATFLALWAIVEFEWIGAIAALIIGDILIDYWWSLNIESKKAKYQSGQNGFNADYYDLYWNLNQSRLKLLMSIEWLLLSFKSLRKRVAIFCEWMLKVEVAAIASPLMRGVLEALEQISTTLLIFLIGVFIWLFVINQCHNNKILGQLIARKGENYSDYTQEEKQLLEQLK